jgi:hypothetical protein
MAVKRLLVWGAVIRSSLVRVVGPEPHAGSMHLVQSAPSLQPSEMQAIAAANFIRDGVSAGIIAPFVERAYHVPSIGCLRIFIAFADSLERALSGLRN